MTDPTKPRIVVVDDHAIIMRDHEIVLLAQTRSIEEVAEQLGLNAATIRKSLSRYEWRSATNGSD